MDAISITRDGFRVLPSTSGSVLSEFMLTVRLFFTKPRNADFLEISIFFLFFVFVSLRAVNSHVNEKSDT